MVAPALSTLVEVMVRSIEVWSAEPIIWSAEIFRWSAEPHVQPSLVVVDEDERRTSSRDPKSTSLDQPRRDISN